MISGEGENRRAVPVADLLERHPTALSILIDGRRK
jgi:hypothetical protein